MRREEETPLEALVARIDATVDLYFYPRFLRFEDMLDPAS
jgi:hypothetical protein